MSAFDAQINVVHNEVGPLPDPQAPENLVAVEVRLVTATMFPTPDGMVPIPLGQLKFGLTKAAAQQLVESLNETIEVLVDPKPRSNIQIATDLNAAKEAADRAQQLRG